MDPVGKLCHQTSLSCRATGPESLTPRPCTEPTSLKTTSHEGWALKS